MYFLASEVQVRSGSIYFIIEPVLGTVTYNAMDGQVGLKDKIQFNMMPNCLSRHKRAYDITRHFRGMRAPFLAIGGNSMYSMLYDANFTYDSSMPIYEELYNSCNNTDSMRAKLFFSPSVVLVVVTLPALFIVLFIYFNGILGFTAG